MKNKLSLCLLYRERELASYFLCGKTLNVLKTILKFLLYKFNQIYRSGLDACPTLKTMIIKQISHLEPTPISKVNITYYFTAQDKLPSTLHDIQEKLPAQLYKPKPQLQEPQHQNDGQHEMLDSQIKLLYVVLPDDATAALLLIPAVSISLNFCVTKYLFLKNNF